LIFYLLGFFNELTVF